MNSNTAPCTSRWFRALGLFFATLCLGNGVNAQECWDCGIDWCQVFPELCIPPPTNPEQSIGRSVLRPGEALQPNTYMPSPNGEYRLSMQQDGNLVLYRNSDQAVLWASWTQGLPGVHLEMQSDGNAVIYDGNGYVYWASWTQGTGSSYLSVQNDGNLVIYGQQAVWHSNTPLGDCGVTLPTNGARQALQSRTSVMPPIYGNQYYSSNSNPAGGPAPGGLTGIEELRVGQRLTSQNGCYSLVMQSDFNLVLYRNTDGYVPWATMTQGLSSVGEYTSGGIWGPYPFFYPSRRLVVQQDGNLVLYGHNLIPALWHTNTPQGYGKILVMQNDGNLALYTDIVAVWAKGEKYNYGPPRSRDDNSWHVCVSWNSRDGWGFDCDPDFRW